MANLTYTNDAKFNTGISPQFPKPLDDRLVIDSVEGLYITKGASESSAPLYGRAYTGMQVTVFISGKPVEMILNSAVPYTPGTVATINASNYLTHWTVVGKSVEDYVNNTLQPTIDSSVKRLDSSVNRVETYLGSAEYKITKLTTATSGYIASYKLQYKALGAASYADIEGTIDIPKDYVLKEVHVCKASYSSGKYTETKKQGDTGWDSDTNPVYLHFLWQTKDSSTTTSESFVKVSDMIATDLAGTVKRVADVSAYAIDLSTNYHNYKTTNDSSISFLKTYTNDTSTRFNTFKGTTDTSIKALDSSVKSLYVQIGAVSGGVVDNINSSISRLNSSVNKLDSSVASLVTQIGAVSGQVISQINSSLSAINTSIQSVNTALSTYKTTTDTSINTLDSSVKSMDTEIKANYRVLDTSIYNTIEGIKEWQEVMATAITNINSRLAALEAYHTS